MGEQVAGTALSQDLQKAIIGRMKAFGLSAEVVLKHHAPSTKKMRLLRVGIQECRLHVLCNVHSGRRTTATYAKGVLTPTALEGTYAQIFALVQQGHEIDFVTVPSEELRLAYFAGGIESKRGVTIYIPRASPPDRPTRHTRRFDFHEYWGLEALSTP